MFIVKDQSSKTRIRLIGALMLLGTFPNFYCLSEHICMAGHMQHGPNSIYHWLNDFLWISCFACVFAFSIYLKARHKMWFLCGTLFLLLSRILDGSGGGGINLILELPLLVVLAILALLYLIKPDIYLKKDEPVSPGHAVTQRP